MRLTWGGRVSITKRSPTLPEPHTVNAAGIRDEGCRPYPGRSDRYACDVQLNCQKSAEAIVPVMGRAEQQIAVCLNASLNQF